MSWEQELIDLYEVNRSKIGEIQYKNFIKNGKEEKNPFVLLPPFHTTVTAQIQIVLSAKGEFVSASKVEEDNKFTIIPVTEKSGSRTAGKAPHPLCDNLRYLAGDYGRYVQDKKGNLRSYYELYMEGLEKWKLSEYTHEKVEAVYLYLKKETLIQDLLKERVLQLDEAGVLSEKIKIQNVSQPMAFVRFIVRSAEGMKTGMLPDECWKDKTLQECFIQYYQSEEGEKNLDYLTGELKSVSYLHSKKIRNEGDGAKLISSNDEANFTFRGRFATKEQAFAIGNETSQKMHNALKWIIRKQGRSFDTLTIVTWESNMEIMPFWDADTETICSMAEEREEKREEEDDDFQDDFLEEEEDEEEVYDGNFSTAKQFFNVLEGYGKRVENTSRMILMAFDAATTGRLSLAEYKSLDTARYLKNIAKWHDKCGWLQYKVKEKQKKSYYGVPGVRDIADILYGSESNGRLTIVDKNGKKLYAELSRRMIPCIWDGRNIPYDLVLTAINKASSPQAYKERYNWERVLTLACSFVKKNLYEKNPKEEWNVALNETCEERDYLYGRLLAVADRIEYRTYDTEKDSGRVTNAKRYMNTFSQRPFETWKIIEENLQPYLNKLPVIERRFYENLIDEICKLFSVDAFKDNNKLSGLYLLGFHSQSYDLKQYKKQDTNGGEVHE